MTRNKLIGFCYLFIVGIALAMAFPVGPEALGPLWTATAALGLLTIAGLVVVHRRRQPVADELAAYGVPVPLDRWQAGLWALLILTALSFGYVRYVAMIQSPDQLVGTLTVADGAARFSAGRAIHQTSFLKVKTLAPVDREIRLRLVGRLEALQPVPDENGVPTLDADGRWRFTQYNLEQESQEIVIPAGTPARWETLIEQPFTHLDRVDVIGQPAGTAKIGVYQPENVVSLFARYGRNVVPVGVLGRITSDPWVYSFKTVLSVTPDYIQYQPNGPYLPVDRQNIRLTLDPATPGYADFARSDAYGYDVALTGELLAAAHAANQGAFDQANYLRNYNIGGQMRLRVPLNGPAPIHVVRPQGADEPRQGNALVEFSLYLRDEMVRVIKQTTPQPNAAFHGALTLGLRYGMQNTVSVASGSHDGTVVPPLVALGKDTDVLIAEEFRASGINHVLAVSGLHVTIITIMFIGIFVMLKVSKKVYVPFIIFALVVFAIITGARPSTLRAVIMNSLFLLTWGYMGEGVRASALLGVPIAAFMILLQNPAMAVDPSFTLSFGAILSLAILTQPFFDIFKKFKGNDFIALIVMIAVLTYAYAAHWLLTVTLRFWLGYFLLAAVVFGLARLLTRRGFTPIRDYGFANLNPGVAGFIAAQFGMQIGMMIPLSAYYFFRWPVAGAYANLIAIPLVGVVLQLSMLAGLLGLIPGIGIYLALLLSAANWVFSTLFLLIGHYFSQWFLYPFVPRPTVRDLFVYYAAVCAFAWWRPLWYRVVRPAWRRASVSLRIVGCAAVALVLAGVAVSGVQERNAIRTAGKLHVSVIAVGYGSAILVDTPDNQAILIDTAFIQTDRGRRNDAERTVLPQIFAKKIKRLDALVLTSPARQRSDGLFTVLQHVDVDRFYLPKSAAGVLAQEPLASLLAKRSPKRLAQIAGGTAVAPEFVAAGDVLYRAECNGQPFVVEALGPAAGDDQAPLSLRISYGDFAMLVPSDLTLAQQKDFLAAVPPEKLKAQVVVAPHHGTAGLEGIAVGIPDDLDRKLAETTGAILKAAGADAVVFEFGNPRPVVELKYKEAVKIHGAAKRAAEDALPGALVAATDVDGAVVVTSDGTDHHVYTQLGATGTNVDEPSLLEIGW
jgi:ComEC/Rec2-related protein